MLTIEEIKKKLSEGIPKGLVEARHNKTGHLYLHNPTGLLLKSVTTKSSGILDNPHLKSWAARLAVENLTKVLFDRPAKDLSREELDNAQTQSILAHQDEFEDAGGVGTQGHKVIENYINDWITSGEKPKKEITSYITLNDARLWAIARSADLFMGDYSAIPIASELLVANVKEKTQKYAGTLDGLMMIIPPSKCDQSLNGKHFWMHRSTTSSLKMGCYYCDKKEDYQFALTDWKTSNSIDKPDYVMQVSAYFEALKAMTCLKPQVLMVIRLDKKQAKYEVRRILNSRQAYLAFKKVAGVYDWLNSEEPKMSPFVEKEIINLTSNT